MSSGVLLPENVLARLRANDTGALAELYTQHAPALRAFANRVVHAPDIATDIVQDIFVSIWERRASLQIRTTITAYLYAAVHRRSLELLRHHYVEQRAEAESVADTHPVGMAVPEQLPLERLERAEIAQAVEAAIAQLPPRAREIAILRWYDRLSRSEIAEALGIAVPTVNNQLTIAARLVRERLSHLRPGF